MQQHVDMQQLIEQSTAIQFIVTFYPQSERRQAMQTWLDKIGGTDDDTNAKQEGVITAQPRMRSGLGRSKSAIFQRPPTEMSAAISTDRRLTVPSIEQSLPPLPVTPFDWQEVATRRGRCH